MEFFLAAILLAQAAQIFLSVRRGREEARAAHQPFQWYPPEGTPERAALELEIAEAERRRRARAKKIKENRRRRENTVCAWPRKYSNVKRRRAPRKKRPK